MQSPTDQTDGRRDGRPRPQTRHRPERAGGATSAGTAAGARLGYVPAIDGLRAVAVLMVVVYHLRPSRLPGGLLGVDMFFVISGFVVTASLQGRSWRNLPELLSHFYARRVRRVLPALLVTLMLASTLVTLFVPWAWQLDPSASRAAVFAALGFSNLVLAGPGSAYGGAPLEWTPFFHTWSLGVEEQFYLLFPFLIWFLIRRGRPAAIGLVAASSLASLALSALLASEHRALAFYAMPTRFWELGAGMLLFLTIERWRPLLRRTDRRGNLAFAAALLLVAAAVLQPQSAGWLPGQLAATTAAAALVAICCAPASLGARLLALAPLRGLGLISYSLYLWHVPVIVLLKGTLGIEARLSAALAILAMLVVSLLSYVLVERPLRGLGVEGRAARRRILAGGGAAALIAAAVTWQISSSPLPFTLVQDVSGGRSLAERRWTDCGGSDRSLGLAGQVVGASGPCVTNSERPRLVVIGDSHAAGYSDMLLRLSRDSGLDVRIHARGGCPYPRLDRIDGRARCADWYPSTLAHLRHSLRPGDILFLSSLHLRRAARQWGPSDIPPPLPPPQERAIAYAAARKSLRELAASGATIIIEAPKPVFRAPVFRCADWFNRHNPICAPGFVVARDEQLESRRPVMAAMRRLEQEVPGLVVWDPFPILCPEATCSAFRKGRPIFLDDNHLGPFGTDLLYPDFRATVSEQLGSQ